MRQERLQKIIAHSGITSRRKAEELILQGRVLVNGQIVRKLGSLADPERDSIRVDGKRVRPQPTEYYAVHKPRGMLSAVSDAQKRPVVTALVPTSRRIYPAGRLDFNSEGLLILTNDGALTREITRAGTIEKFYRVKVQGTPTLEQVKRLRRGIRIGGTRLAPCRIRFLKKGENCWFEVVLRQGRNRQIREMFAQLGYSVMRLKRVAIGPVSLGNLSPGGYRRLNAEEVRQLKQLMSASARG